MLLRGRIAQDGDDIFSYVRLILPAFDLDRPRYQLRHVGIVRAYKEALGLSKDSSLIRKLQNWNKPTVRLADGSIWRNPFTADFGAVIERALQYRAASHSTLTIGQVNALLDDLHSKGSFSERVQVFREMLRVATAQEHKWIVRIILDDLKVNLRTESFFREWHPDAQELFNTTSSLREVCQHPGLRDPRTRLPKLGVQPGRPFRPMLCSKHIMDNDSTKLLNALRGHSFFVEQKLDGERVLLHKLGETIQCWSRNIRRYEEYEHIFASLCRENVGDPGTEAILDGEMLAWSEREQAYLPFGSNRTLGLEEKTRDNDGRNLVFIAFDVLFVKHWSKQPELAGDVTVRPLQERKKILKDLVRKVPHRLDRIKHKLIDSQDKLHRLEKLNGYLEDAIRFGMEGLVLKRATSEYNCNDRRNDWIKLKPEYNGGSTRTLDVAILGGNFSKGTRRTGLSHFLVGVAHRTPAEWKPRRGVEGPQAGLPIPEHWRVIGRVGTGYNAEELGELRRRLESKWYAVPRDASDRPVFPEWLGPWRPKAHQVPDVLVDPKDTVLVEVMAASITPSDVYNSGFTLRFPRVVRGGIRDDKGPEECDDLRTVVALFEQRHGRLAVSQGDQASGSPSQRTSRKRGPSSSQSQSSVEAFNRGLLLADFEAQGLSDEPVTSNVLHSWEICVLPQQDGWFKVCAWCLVDRRRHGRHPTGMFASTVLHAAFCQMMDEYNSKAKLESLAHRLGASVTQTPRPGFTRVIIAAAFAQKRVENLMQADCDIARPEWLIECARRAEELDAGPSPPPLLPRWMLHTSRATRAELAGKLDSWGDHFTDPVRGRDLLQLFADMDTELAHSLYCATKESSEEDVEPAAKRRRVRPHDASESRGVNVS